MNKVIQFPMFRAYVLLGLVNANIVTAYAYMIHPYQPKRQHHVKYRLDDSIGVGLSCGTFWPALILTTICGRNMVKNELNDKLEKSEWWRSPTEGKE